ncbi:hypothetical protein V495_06834 [Pseudogymnoascus sp. VKM F-4514 (FW-929)]|nr:hypothetical protein V490_07357 [Pseudogymnoascus sp. VKM F-3557]KFY37955.1 hypothetical protein V495_06834 [Pseudogymnoascus sp. VKM F-4514 (FW-929)]KFY51506.1 hypothetical protein V497_09068 [Pseudogymnoascus sp. VKM F-4516 (FW-969)]
MLGKVRSKRRASAVREHPGEAVGPTQIEAPCIAGVARPKPSPSRRAVEKVPAGRGKRCAGGEGAVACPAILGMLGVAT